MVSAGAAIAQRARQHFERLRRVMMGHENFDDMRARYVQVKASGDDMDDPKLYVDSKPGRPPK